MAGPVAVSSDGRPDSAEREQAFKPDFELNDPVHGAGRPAEIDHKLMRYVIRTTPPGSWVRLGVDCDREYLGILLNSGATSVRLMNCICREAVPAPDGQMQRMTSHIPLQSFKTSSLTHFTVLAEPPPGYIAPDFTKDGSGLRISEIVFGDGRRQRLGRPPEPKSSDEENNLSE